MGQKLNVVTGFITFPAGRKPVTGRVRFGQLTAADGASERRAIITSVDGSASAWLPSHVNLVRLCEQVPAGAVAAFRQLGTEQRKGMKGTLTVYLYDAEVLDEGEWADGRELDVSVFTAPPKTNGKAKGKPAREPGSDDNVPF